MKIITEPNVHLSAYQVFNPHPDYELPPEENDGHKLIAHAGKLCYDSFGKDGRSIEDHIQSHFTNSHGSVLEHSVVSLTITGISRGLSHELVRHRPFSFSQRSTRYTSEEGAAIVLDPFYAKLYQEWFDGKWEFNYQEYHEQRDFARSAEETILTHFLGSCYEDLQNYGHAVRQLMEWSDRMDGTKTKVEKRKWARGKARQLLPHALETRIVMTGNIRAWRWFIELRSDHAAEPEIRRLAEAIFPILAKEVPYCFKDYKPIMIDGIASFITVHRKT